MKKVWLSSGGNIGNVPQAFSFALHAIGARTDCRIKNVSSLYRTAPWGLKEQDVFFNAAWEIETILEPEELLALCLDLEKQCGRERTVKWGPRTLDIDVLVYEGVDDYSSAELTLPHPFLTERAFVLVPLCEIAPSLIVKKKTVSEWAQSVEKNGIEKLDIGQKWWQI